jgi:hypothetical protein
MDTLFRVSGVSSKAGIFFKAGSNRLRYAVLAAAGLAFAASAPAKSATLRVCKNGCEFAVIQEAINAAASGDKINVGVGIFFEHLTIIAKNLVIVGSGEDFTVIDGGFFGTTVSVGDNIGADFGSLTLSSVTVTHASTGGIVVNDVCTLNLLNSMVISNLGGGITNLGGTTTIGSSIIALNKTSGLGGGISNSSEGRLTISSSTIARNTAGGGGGIFIDNLTQTTVSNSTISDNTANNSAVGTVGSGEGGGILLSPRDEHSPQGSLNISNTALVNNHAALDGGGVWEQGQFVPLATVFIEGNTPDNCRVESTPCTPP